MADPVKNFAKVIVVGGYSASATEITLQTGEGLKIPNPETEGAFNMVWWNYTDYKDPSDDPNRGIVRVIAKTDDIITVVRGQEGIIPSSKNVSGKQYYMMIAFTKKMYDEASNIIEADYLPEPDDVVEIDMATGRRHVIQMPAGGITLDVINVKRGDIFLIEIIQDGVGGRLVDFFETINWVDGVAPSLTATASKKDSFVFVCTSVGTYNGYITGQNI